VEITYRLKSLFHVFLEPGENPVQEIDLMFFFPDSVAFPRIDDEFRLNPVA